MKYKAIQKGRISGHGKEIQDQYNRIGLRVPNYKLEKLRKMWGGRRGGARGKGCDPIWYNSFEEFANYIMTLDGWDSDLLEIDRIDNSKGYEPGNVRFATKTTNMRNRSSTLIITLPDGSIEPMMDVLESFLGRKVRNGEAVYQRAVRLIKNRKGYEDFIAIIGQYK